MEKYAKITEEGKIIFFRGIPCVINPKPEQVEKYLKENGFKLYVSTPRPGKYYSMSYDEQEEEIHEVWTPNDLDSAKIQGKEVVQMNLTITLSDRTTIPCKGFTNGIIYDQDALTNAMGVEEGDSFIDAADGIHILTAEMITNIKKALKEHRQSLYLVATVRRGAIDAAETVDDVERAETQNYTSEELQAILVASQA